MSAFRARPGSPARASRRPRGGPAAGGSGAAVLVLALTPGCGRDVCDTEGAAHSFWVAPADRQIGRTDTDLHAMTGIQAAVDALAPEGGFGVVCVGTGTYVERLVVPGNVAVRAAEGAAVVVVAPDAEGATVTLEGTLPDPPAELRGVTVRGDGTGVRVVGYGLVADVRIEDVAKGIEVEAEAYADVQGGEIAGARLAPAIEGRARARLSAAGTRFVGNLADVRLDAGGEVELAGTDHAAAGDGADAPVRVRDGRLTVTDLGMTAHGGLPSFIDIEATDAVIDRATFHAEAEPVPAVRMLDDAAPASSLVLTDAVVFSRGGGGAAAFEIGADCTLQARFVGVAGLSGGFGAVLRLTGDPASLTVVDTVAWGNGAFLDDGGFGSVPDVSFSLIEGGFEGEQVLDVDPQFADPGRADLRPGSPDSPLVDAGTPVQGVEVDLAGDPRLAGDAPDIGPYEFQF